MPSPIQRGTAKERFRFVGRDGDQYVWAVGPADPRRLAVRGDPVRRGVVLEPAEHPMTPVEFLNARLDEVEQRARKATPGPWELMGFRDSEDPDDEEDPVTCWQVLADAGHDTHIVVADAYVQPLSTSDFRTATNERGYPVYPPGDTAEGRDLTHIAYWDPHRVLAWCEAVRRLLQVHRAKPSTAVVFCRCCDDFYPCDTLKILATLFSDHPDYQESWRP